MSLIEYTLFGMINKVEIAIARLKEFEPPEGYYLAFSGGKDSQCIYHLAVEAGVKFDAHYSLTTVDPPELVKFIRENYPDVKWERPKETMWQIIQRKSMPPTRLVRYCCEILKEGGGDNRAVITGIRNQESAKRSKRKMVEQCFKNKHKTYINPIIDWSNWDVWEFIRSNDLEYCKLYDQGYSRLGCIMCPMQGKDGMLRDMVRYPTYARAYLRAFKKMLKGREERGLATEWTTAVEVMEWWIYGKETNDTTKDPDQTVMFE